jgi:hypothetical protein
MYSPTDIVKFYLSLAILILKIDLARSYQIMFLFCMIDHLMMKVCSDMVARLHPKKKSKIKIVMIFFICCYDILKIKNILIKNIHLPFSTNT